MSQVLFGLNQDETISWKVDFWSKKKKVHNRNVHMYEITDPSNIEERLSQINREISLVRKVEEIQSLVLFVPSKSVAMSCLEYIFEKFQCVDFEIINSRTAP